MHEHQRSSLHVQLFVYKVSFLISYWVWGISRYALDVGEERLPTFKFGHPVLVPATPPLDRHDPMATRRNGETSILRLRVFQRAP